MSIVKFVNIDEVHDHPTLPHLGIVQLELGGADDGCLIVVEKDELTVGEKALYFPVGCTVDDKLTEFSFLQSPTIEPMDFGEVQSQGLLIPVPSWYKYGRNPDVVFLGHSVESDAFFVDDFEQQVKIAEEVLDEVISEEKLEKMLVELCEVADAIGADMVGDEVDEEVP